MEFDKDDSMKCEPETSITKSLDVLEEEKNSLDANLKQLLQKKNLTEASVASIRSKLENVTALQSRLNDSLNMAKAKAKQIEAQTLGFERTNKEVKEKIAKLQEKVVESKTRRSNALNQFEEQLDLLRKLFAEGVTYYTENKLNEEITNSDEEFQHLTKEAAEVEAEINQVDLDFQKLSMSSQENWDQDLSLEYRTLLLHLFEEENYAVITCLEQLREQKKRLSQEMQTIQRI